MTILLKNGTVIDYKSKLNKKTDILIENSKVSKIADNIDYQADKIIDCNSLFIIPGLIDTHCHLREPGFLHKETIETGCNSAVKGGFTTICPMPNTKPTTDNVEILTQVINEATRINLCNVIPYAAVTIGEQGEELTNFESLKEAGCIAFSDDGIPVKNAKIMKEAIIKANSINSFVASHCEEMSLAEGAINEGEIARKLNLAGVAKEAEEIMVAREIVLAENTKSHVHICHISTAVSVALIRDAKRRGINVTCETCPHYYSFTEEEVLTSGSNAKMNPPLRTEQDRLAIIEGLKNGTIDAIGTDHAPHSEEEKSGEISKTPNGILGFETALSSAITHLLDKEINYLDLVKLFSYGPAKVLGLDKGYIEENAIADLTIFDPNVEYVYSKEDIVSKSKNSPFIGKNLKGKVIYTIVNGEVKYK